jgi:hypothetical protein
MGVKKAGSLFRNGFESWTIGRRGTETFVAVLAAFSMWELVRKLVGLK